MGQKMNYRNTCYRFDKNGKCIWFTGLQCSGKTTLAKHFIEMYNDNNNYILLDGDAIRKSINYDLSFDQYSITTNVTKIANLAKVLMDQGYNVIVSCVSKYKSDRALAKAIIGNENYFEVFCNCDNKVLNERRSKVHFDTPILFNTYEQSDYSVFEVNTTTDKSYKKDLEELHYAIFQE